MGGGGGIVYGDWIVYGGTLDSIRRKRSVFLREISKSRQRRVLNACVSLSMCDR